MTGVILGMGLLPGIIRKKALKMPGGRLETNDDPILLNMHLSSCFKIKVDEVEVEATWAKHVNTETEPVP